MLKPLVSCFMFAVKQGGFRKSWLFSAEFRPCPFACFISQGVGSMKIVNCKDCGLDKCVPDEMPEPWICADCQALHKKNEGHDFALEAELDAEADA